MSKKLTKVLALAMVLVMVFALAACQKDTDDTENSSESTETANTETSNTGSTETENNSETTEEPTPEGTLVYATSTFGQKFSPFFYTTAYDEEVVSAVHISLLASDRGGAVIYNGIEGETVAYNGTDYTYYGAGDVEVVQNDDGSVDYNLTMRDDIVFSDGVPATIDDVIFGIYVMCDPTYDGSSTIYALPILGMEEYRSGMDSRMNLILAAGRDGYTATDYYTEAEYNEFWEALDKAGTAFAQEIVDYCVANYIDYSEDYIGATAEEVTNDEGLQVELGMLLWGFGDYWQEGATALDYWYALEDAYAYDYTSLSDTESANSDLFDLLNAELGDDANVYATGVQTGSGAANISGIEKTGDYSMTVHMSSYDATAIYEMGFIIAPLHYYGDESLYDYDNNQFGFVKGDLSGVKSKNTTPLGAGPYTYESYSNGVVTLKANTSYFLGVPATEYVLMQESVDSDYVPGINAGTYDIAVPSISDDTLNAIKDANSNDEITGDVITTVLVDYRGYGYIGINADLVNVDGDPDSEESKNLRKAYMTVMSVYRDTVINSYYGDRAAVIQYPISNTSWAAPQPADVGYKNAYSTAVDGSDIYDSSMSDEQKYEAALAAAIDYFKAAGYTYDEATGKFTDVPEHEIMIPGQGEGDHPAYGIATSASTALESIGVKLQVNDVQTATWNNALEGNTVEIWAAAWQASVDPDMTQVYSGVNAHGNGTNSNHYSIDDAELDELIAAGRSSADTEERKSIYKEAFEIILDWGVELPLYQRKDCTCFSSQRIDIATIPQDMTPYWSWKAELETLAVQ